MSDSISEVFTAELHCPKCKIGNLKRGSTDAEKWTTIECNNCDYNFKLAIVIPKQEEQE